MAKEKKIHHPELEQDSQDVLSKIKKVNPFTTPNGYFERLPEAIFENIHQATGNKALYRRQGFQATPIRLAVAAFILLVFAAAIYWLVSSGTISKISSGKTITWDILVDNNGKSLIEFDDAILVETLAQEMTLQAPEVLSDSVTEEDIINYLVIDYDN
jgi:hypothetical protein